MSLNDIFGTLVGWLGGAANGVWNYPVPWDQVFAFLIFGVLLILGIAVLISWTARIFAPLPPRKKSDPK